MANEEENENEKEESQIIDGAKHVIRLYRAQ
jgi:hypothetical protein